MATTSLTDLFVACAGFAPDAIAAVIPPSVQRLIDAAPYDVRGDGEGAVIDAGPWRPRTPARHLLPSLALLTAKPYGLRFEISVRRDERWLPWVTGVSLGQAPARQLPAAADGVRVEIDEFHADPAIEGVRVRARVQGPGASALSQSPWLLSLSAWNGDAHMQEPQGASAGPLTVPPRSQMGEDEPVRARICSPTSTAMVMEYCGASVPTRVLADEVFHAPTDRYGVWPAAIKAAAAHGVPGYLLRFPDWNAAQWCLEHGLPIVASLRYGEGELTGAPMSWTTGHLVVITGMDDGRVLVNDPAAETPGEVPRRYRLAEFARAWLGGSGVGYVFFRR